MSCIDDLIRQHSPDGVQTRPIGEIGVLVRGNGIQKSDFVAEGVGCIHYGQIHTHYGTWATETKSFVSAQLAAKTRLADPGDLVIATTSEDDEAVGKAVAWLGSESVAVSTDAFILRHSMDPKFVAYFFQTEQFQAQKRRHVTGTKVRRISGEALAKINIPVPPLEVQREIVRVLDLFQSLEAELEAELEARRRQYAHYRDSLLSPAANHDKFKLGDLLELIIDHRGKTPSKLGGTWVECGHRVISALNFSNGEIDLNDHHYIDDEIFSKWMRNPLKSGDVLLTSEAPLGAVAYVGDDSDWALGQRVFGLRPRIELINGRYLYHLLAGGPPRKELLRRATGSTVLGIRQAELVKIEIHLPSLEVQAAVASTLDKLDALVNDLSIGLPAELAARRSQYEHYRDRLLTFEEAA